MPKSSYPSCSLMYVLYHSPKGNPYKGWNPHACSKAYMCWLDPSLSRTFFKETASIYLLEDFSSDLQGNNNSYLSNFENIKET